MKKSNFVALVLGTIGGIFFALGMCMVLTPEWEAGNQGIIAGVIGIVILIADLFIWRKMEGKEPIKVDAKVVRNVVVGILGALLLGVGMCLAMLSTNMILGIGVGLVGIVILLMLIPLIKGVHA